MIWLSMLLACGGDSAPKRWWLWAPMLQDGSDQADDPFATYCGDDFAYADNFVWDRNTNETWPIPNDLPVNWLLGTAGPVTCVGRRLFTSPPEMDELWISDDGGPWTLVEHPEPDSFYTSVMASRAGDVYRSVRFNTGVPPRIERSSDGGDTWESVVVNPVNPSGADAVSINLFHVDGFLGFAVWDNDLNGGQVRADLDGQDMVLSTDGFREYESPTPLVSHDGLTLAYDAGLPEFFDSYLLTDRDPKLLAASDYETVMMAGPPQAIFAGQAAMYGYGVNLSLHADGHLVTRDNFRTTSPVDSDMRDQVLLGKNCKIWEYVGDKLGDLSGPGQLTLSHSGGDPVYVGYYQTTRLDFLDPAGGTRVLPDLLEAGMEMEINQSGGPVFFMDELGRCRGVLTEKDSGDQDVADWL